MDRENMPSFFHPIFGHGNEHLEEQHLYNALNAFMAQPTSVTIGPSELAAEYGTALPSSAMGSEYHHQGNQLYDASELNFSDYLHDQYATVTEAAPPHEPSFVSAAYTASGNDSTLDDLFEESASVTEGAPSHEPSFVGTAYTDVSAPSNVPEYSSVSAPDNFFAPVNVSSQAQHQHQPDELPTSSAAEVVTATDTSCIDPQLLAGPEPIVTPASALEALRIEWWNHFHPGQAPKYAASAAPAPVPTSSNINVSPNGSTCASVAQPPATPAVDTAAAPATPAASVVSAKSGRDLDRFDESDVLGAVSKDYAKRTIYKSATEARDSQRRRVQTREDPSIPRDEETKRALVAVLVEALESTEHAVDSEKTIQPFRAGRYTKEVLEVAAWDLMEAMLRRHLDGGSLTLAHAGKPAGHFIDRFRTVRKALFEYKSICKHVLDPLYVNTFVDEPTVAFKRVEANKKVNDRKSGQISAGKRALAGELAEALTPTSTPEEPSAPITPPPSKKRKGSSGASSTLRTRM